MPTSYYPHHTITARCNSETKYHRDRCWETPWLQTQGNAHTKQYPGLWRKDSMLSRDKHHQPFVAVYSVFFRVYMPEKSDGPESNL